MELKEKNEKLSESEKNLRNKVNEIYNKWWLIKFINWLIFIFAFIGFSSVIIIIWFSWIFSVKIFLTGFIGTLVFYSIKTLFDREKEAAIKQLQKEIENEKETF